MTLSSRIQQKLHSNNFGITVFFLAVIATCVVIFTQIKEAIPDVKIGAPIFRSTQPTLSGELSQTKIVTGEEHQVYLSLSVETPKDGTSNSRKPTDFVVVLDRSGSMAAENKLPYAKAAVESLLSQLSSNDRFALITFDTDATLTSGLTNVSSAERERLTGLVRALTPGSSTNISGALEMARGLFTDSENTRSRRVLLLSDGEANVGISDYSGLINIAKVFPAKGVVMSAVGMGLGFNETLMSGLADSAMGNYSYLETLNSLGDVLAKDLSQSRSIYASKSDLELKLAENVKLIDAAGYPIEQKDSSTWSIPFGQLLSGSNKKVILSFSVPALPVGEASIGALALNYTADGSDRCVSLAKESVMLAVLEKEKRQEAVASLKEDVYRSNWTQNYFGRLQANVASLIKSGNKPAAQAAIVEYKDAVGKAERESGVMLVDKDSNERIDELGSVVEDAFIGSAPEQAEKQNRYAKAKHAAGRELQRNE